MIKSLLSLSFLCCSLCVSMEIPNYNITIHGRVTPVQSGAKLDLRRSSLNLNSNVELYKPSDKFKRFTELISELCLETPSKEALDTLVENYVATRILLVPIEKEWRDTASLSTALINVARTPIEDIEQKMIKTYVSKNEDDITSLKFPALFAITQSDGTDITKRLSGKLTPEKTTEYVVKFRNKLITQLSELPHIPIVEEYDCNSQDYKEKLNKFLTEKYENDISTVISNITTLQDQIFADPILTKIYFRLEFNRQYFNNIFQKRLDTSIPGIPPKSISSKEVVKLLLININQTYTEEDSILLSKIKEQVEKSIITTLVPTIKGQEDKNVALVSNMQEQLEKIITSLFSMIKEHEDENITRVYNIQEQLEENEGNLQTTIGSLLGFKKENLDRITDSLMGYVHMYQLLIFSPYR